MHYTGKYFSYVYCLAVMKHGIFIVNICDSSEPGLYHELL